MPSIRIETEQEANFALVLVLATERAAHMVIRTLTMINSLFLATDPSLATVLILATILDHAPVLVNRSCRSLQEATLRCRLHTPHQDILVHSLLVSRDRIRLMVAGACQCQFTERSIPHQPDPCLAWLRLIKGHRCQWFCAAAAHR
jgi:hypothetical protein